MDSNIFCSPCFIAECNYSIQIPYYLGDGFIMPIDRLCHTFKEHTFYTKLKIFNTTLNCIGDPIDKYICDVFVEPMAESYTEMCLNKKINIGKIQKKSFCNSFNGCFDISKCYRKYTFCYDNKSIPYLKINNETRHIKECEEKKKRKRKYTRMERELFLFTILIFITNICNIIMSPRY